MTSRNRLLAGNLILAAVYVVSGKLGLLLAGVNASAPAVWPPTGVALAALLWWGSRLWPGVFVGAFLVTFTTQGSLATSLGIAGSSTLEALAGAWLVRRFAGGLQAFERTSSFFRFVLLAGIGSTALGAAGGAASLCLGGVADWEHFGAIGLSWWLADLVSTLAIVPLLMVWLSHGWLRLMPRQWVEAAGLLATVLLVGQIVFLRHSPPGAYYPLTYLAIPPLMWAAFRFGVRGATIAAFLTVSLALWGTLQGRGPFARLEPNASLLLLQAFAGTSALTALALALAVSERRQIRQALQESQAKLHGIISSAMDAIISVDGRQRIVIFNSAAEKMFRCPAAQALGEPLDKFIPARFRQAHRHHVEKFGQTGTTSRKMGATEALTALRANGEEFPIEASISQVQVGQERLFTVILRDITARKRVEEQLRLQAVALESAANAILITNREGRIEWVNGAFSGLTGYSAAEALGQNPRLLKSGRHSPAFFKGMWETVLAGRVWHGEVVNKRKDGSLYTEEMTITPVPNGRGAGDHFVAIKQDVTARKQAEEALREAKEDLARSNARLEELVQERTAKLQELVAELEQFSYSIVHDMRAPLRGIQGFAGMLEEEAAPALTPQARKYLTHMRTAANRMDLLITDALSYSQAVRSELPVRPVDVGALLQGMLDSYPELAPAQADIELAGTFPKVLGNEAGLTQCFSNLLLNAVKFVKPGQRPRVRVWAEQRQGAVRVWVEDNGVGIPQEGLQKIFGMFQRMHGAEYKGTGIGLALVRKVVERMGGRVGVESQVGQGSRFWVELRAAET